MLTSTHEPLGAENPPLNDIAACRQRLARGDTDAARLLTHNLEAAQSPACHGAWVRQPDPTDCARQLQQLQNRWGNQLCHQPLAGLTVSIKDLFDVTGEVSTAGSRLLGPQGLDRPAATCDAPAVARLRAAGAVLFGRTQMSEFAFSGVGINPHHGTPRNPCDAAVHRIPGGSSSGGAVTVATGAAWAALGSDTGGSIRIPAALCGIVGFKSTARRVPTAGTVALSHTLDTVAAMTLSVRDAVLLHEVLGARTVTRSPAPLSECHFAVPNRVMLDGLELAVARAFDRTLSRLSAAGARITPIDLAELDELAPMQSECTFAAAESAAWHRDWIDRHGVLYDPRVLQRIQRGTEMRAASYVRLVTEREAWIERVNQRIGAYDALLSPTVPVLAPVYDDVAPGADRDAAFFATNSLLLRNPAAVNLLDGCALSLPCHSPDELPVGLMVWHGAMRDDGVLHAGLRIEEALVAREPS